MKFKIENPNIVNQRRCQRLVIDVKTSLRLDVVLKSLPRIIKKYFIANYKKFMDLMSKDVKKEAYSFENIQSYVSNLLNFRKKYENRVNIYDPGHE